MSSSPKNPPGSASTLEPSLHEIFAKALVTASVHVHRQQFARHEQDRKDAVEWLKKHEELMAACRTLCASVDHLSER